MSFGKTLGGAGRELLGKLLPGWARRASVLGAVNVHPGLLKPLTARLEGWLF